MARLVTSGVAVVVGCPELVEHCRAVLAAGPGPLAPEALRLARHTLTDLLDDLADRSGAPSPELTVVAVATWQATAELLLAAAVHWTVTGTWLVRELADLVREAGTAWVDRLDAALCDALAGDVLALASAADAALEALGGRLRSGFTVLADLPR